MQSEVALVSMPHASSSLPSVGLGLLKASIETRGIPADVKYLNVEFESQCPDDGVLLLETLPKQLLIGDFIFSSALWGARYRDVSEYADLINVEMATMGEDAIPTSHLPSVLDRLLLCGERFIADSLLSQNWSGYKVVGFTTSFHQNAASLALAKLIKDAFPDVVIAFGGANCEGQMGERLISSFDFIDVVCVGEGEDSFPSLVEDILLERDFEAGPWPNIVFRTPTGLKRGGRSLTRNLDALPVPDYGNFFEMDRRSSSRNRLMVPFETSRGCWWGERSHCTFCGLNGSGMAYRSKSPERLGIELLALKRAYGAKTRKFLAVDNIIPPKGLKLFAETVSRAGIDVFFETRATLRSDEISWLSDAGVTSVQPGIESLSTASLRLMKKGCNAITNVRFLRLCAQFGILPLWNYLVGLPGESYDDLDEVTKLIRHIPHLESPQSGRVTEVRVDRFSPFHEDPGTYGIDELQPSPAYRIVYYALPPDAIKDIAYFFSTRISADSHRALSTIDKAVRNWEVSHKTAGLVEIETSTGLLIGDFRHTTGGDMLFVDPQWRDVYMKCRNIASFTELLRVCPLERREALNDWLEFMLERGLLWRERDQYVSLPVKVGNGYFPNDRIRSRILAWIENHAVVVA